MENIMPLDEQILEIAFKNSSVTLEEIIKETGFILREVISRVKRLNKIGLIGFKENKIEVLSKIYINEEQKINIKKIL